MGIGASTYPTLGLQIRASVMGIGAIISGVGAGISELGANVSSHKIIDIEK